MITLPVFPLSIFLLPQGVTKLRIFEPRYLKMVGIALSGQGFVLWPSDKKTNIYQQNESNPWASWVEIINFDQGDDGVLEIDIKCKSLVEIKSITRNDDNLHFGEVSQLEHWSENDIDEPLSELSVSLADVFTDNQELDDLYVQQSLNNHYWVLARWLEILPVNFSVKNSFVIDHNYQEAKEFVESVIFK